MSTQHKPEDYKALVWWCKQSQFNLYENTYIEEAVRDQAPILAVFKHGGDWVTLDQIRCRATRAKAIAAGFDIKPELED